MLNRSFFASFLLVLNLTGLLGFIAAAPAAESATGQREIIPFDASWRFHLGDEPAANQPKFDDINWRTLDLGGSAAVAYMLLFISTVFCSSFFNFVMQPLRSARA